MLRVRVASRLLSIEWAHWPMPDENSEKAGTSCRIYDANTLVLLVQEDSWLHPNDRFDKEIGRKVSLAKALGKLFPGDSSFVSRKTVWEAYFARKGQKPLQTTKTWMFVPPETTLAWDIETPESTPWAQLAGLDTAFIGAPPKLPLSLGECQCSKTSAPPPRCPLHPGRRWGLW